MPSGPVWEASCYMILLAKSSVLHVDFDVAVQASLAENSALASAAESRGTSTSRSDCDLFWSCWCWPSQFWYLSQLLPCYHLLKPTFLLSIFLHVNRLIWFLICLRSNSKLYYQERMVHHWVGVYLQCLFEGHQTVWIHEFNRRNVGRSSSKC